MKVQSILLASAGFVSAAIDFGNWHPQMPERGEVRSPCPGLNTLANHGIIPRDGKNLNVPILVKALGETYNLSAEISTVIANGGLKTSSNPASGNFTLEDLTKHGLIEHDASLSRKDASEGDNYSFSPVIFQEYTNYLRGVNDLTHNEIAAARWGRVQTERRRDKNFSFKAKDQFNSYSESALFFRVLNDPKTGKTPLEFVKVFFEQERLPFKEGWRTPPKILEAFALAGDILTIALLTPGDNLALANSGEAGETFHGGKFL